ncbi:hypothetical protein EMMF5_003394 [Cystobasidiomycetes sp. EMM_F5]
MKLSLGGSNPQNGQSKGGLSLKGKATSGNSLKPGKPSQLSKGKEKLPAFGADDDEDDNDEKNAANGPVRIDPSRAGTSTKSRTLQKTHAAATEVDPSIFAYDEVYDNMKAAEAAAVQARKNASESDKPKYVSGLLQAAETRKKDRIRAEDKLIEREREKEGDEFQDKDAFVTQAYKEQQAELRRAEEEERIREEQEAKKPGGMAAYYRDELARKEAIHAAAMAAATSAALSAQSAAEQPTETAAEADLRAHGPKSESALAAEASAALGRTVQVNESGEIIDKRELLVGGLNVKPRRIQGPASGPLRGFGLSIAERKKAAEDEAVANREKERKEREDLASLGMTGLTMAQRQQMSRERQSKEMEKQLLEHQERKRKADEDRQNEVVKRIAKRNNDESKVEELKRRALERRLARQQQNTTAGETETLPS